MKKLYFIFSIILFFTVLVTPVYGGANTYSLDLELDTDDYAWAADSADLSITGDITVEAWVNMESLSATHYILSKWTGGGCSYAFEVLGGAPDIGRLQFEYTDAPSCVSQTSLRSDDLVATETATWYHLAIAVDVSAKSGSFYVNGSAVDTSLTGSQSATSIVDTTTKFVIGAHSEGDYGNQFDGYVDEVRIWSDIRTAQEISDNYQTQLNGDETNLVAYWMLNNNAEDKGETTNPTGSDSDDLTLVNSAAYDTEVPFSGIAPAVAEVKRQGVIWMK